ncbi:M90 family metallopeptidase [Ideonella livida]|uniref:Zinc-dependent peptidase n=1 Tax=Ideonella livida TaxID=2707176 RepID=A0A7C9PJ97_9BURK|nr:M90 family metallopeptidase [Ideonella livida]NDY92552.1 zinc-dependent peptidase [Ideonella livida]
MDFPDGSGVEGKGHGVEGLNGVGVAVLLGLAAALAMVLQPRWRRARRERVAAQPLPEAWRQALRDQVPLLARLPAPRQRQLRQRLQVFLAEVPFIGCAGLEVTEAMRLSIAAQACLLLLGRPEASYESLRQVLVYPGGFVVDRQRRDEAGVVHEERVAHAGESWAEGQVVLSWDDVAYGAEVPDDGMNVVLHEFAHQLDQAGLRVLSGPPGPQDAPAPPATARAHAAWQARLDEAFEAFCARCAAGRPGLLDPYGATAPEEFFAVATEAFFEQPLAMRYQLPGLYADLQAFYGQDPAGW